MNHAKSYRLFSFVSWFFVGFCLFGAFVLGAFVLGTIVLAVFALDAGVLVNYCNATPPTRLIDLHFHVRT